MPSRYMANLRHARYFKEIIAIVNRDFRQRTPSIERVLRTLDLEWENIKRSRDWLSQQSDTKAELLELCADQPRALVYYQNLRQHPAERITWFRAGLAAAQRLGRQRDEAIHLGNLGEAFMDLGQTQVALNYYQQALAIARIIQDQENEAANLASLAAAYLRLGDARRAIDYNATSLGIVRQLGDRLHQAALLGEMANAYQQLGYANRSADLYD